jgi:hypothetical protein
MPGREKLGITSIERHPSKSGVVTSTETPPDPPAPLYWTVQVIGAAKEEDMWFVTNPNARAYMQRLPRYQHADFAIMFAMGGPEAADLLNHMLEFDPMKRITIEQVTLRG